MLALIFRGVFLLGVVGWYSTSLWMMIDGYFKDQFKRYLEDEYQRNPKMREGVYAASAVNKPDSPLTDISRQAELQQLLESCGLDDCPVDKAGSLEPAPTRWEDESAGTPVADSFEAGAAEKEVARPADAFRETAGQVADAEPPDKKEENNVASETIGKEKEANIPILEEPKQEPKQEPPQEEFHHQQQQQQEQEPQKQQRDKQQKSQGPRKRRPSNRPQIGAKSEEAAKRKQRQHDKVPTLTLTDDDFVLATRKRRFTREYDEDEDEDEDYDRDRDFSEFDDEYNRVLEEDESGIPVADLPYKPAINIYDLERLSEEEFCPLTLDEDDSSCEETRAWP